MKLRSVIASVSLTVFLLSSGNSVLAVMTSTNYQINWDSISGGGDNTSSSASYNLRDTVGGAGIGSISSTSYSLNSGYRAGVYDRTADFAIYIEDRASQVAASALSSETVALTSSSGFAVGDMIALVQNEGEHQVAAVAKIESISSPNVTVDFWSYSSVMPVIDGINDYLYALDQTSVSLGTLVPGNVSTGIIAWDVTAEVDDGYSVYLYESQDLSYGSNSIADVSDGNVGGTIDEYGARSSDTTLGLSTFDTFDTAITSTPNQIASESGTNFSKRGFITLKATVDGTVPDGTYSQNLMILYVGDY